jgi:peptidoglycan/LPS O-acetylase OafA/YrhL
MTSAKKSAGRFAELDGLRGIAAFWVVLYHYVYRYESAFDVERDLWFKVAISGVPERALGDLPVYLFFMISGFVIFMTVERCATGLDFAVSRFARLFPAYWTGVALTFSVLSLWPLLDVEIAMSTFAVNLTMLQGYFYLPHVDGVYWSLQIELGFYFCAFLVLVSSLQSQARPLCLFWLALAYFAWYLPDLVYDRVEMLLALRYAEFFIAGITFYHLRQGTFKSADAVTLVGCALLIVFRRDPGVALVCVLFLGVFALAVLDKLRMLASRPLIWLGAVSYSLYLTHQMIGYRIISALDSWGVGDEFAVLITICIALLLAHTLTFTVERASRRAIVRRYEHYKAGRE